jgi:hypothetical protein
VISAHDTDVDAYRLRQLATPPDLRQMRDWRHFVSPKRVVRFVRRRDGFRHFGIGPNQQSAAFTRHILPRMGSDCLEYCLSNAHQISGAQGA